MHGVVTKKIQPEEHRCGRLRAVGLINEQVHPRPLGLPRKPHGDFFPGGGPAERAAVHRRHLEPQRGGQTGRRASVDFAGKKSPQLRPPLGLPRGHRAHRRPVGADQRIGQGVGRDFSFVGNRGIRRGGQQRNPSQQTSADTHMERPVHATPSQRSDLPRKAQLKARTPRRQRAPHSHSRRIDAKRAAAHVSCDMTPADSDRTAPRAAAD